MLKPDIQDAFNKQITGEYYSSYLYLSMAAWFESKGLKGFAHWMLVQSQEELTHVLKFFKFIHDRNGRVQLEAIDQPPREWESPLDVFRATLAHEEDVTASIDQLVDLALHHRDHAAYNFLQWFVAEQVEEEANVGDLISQLELVADDGRALLMLDRELAQRVPVVVSADTIPV